MVLLSWPIGVQTTSVHSGFVVLYRHVGQRDGGVVVPDTATSARRLIVLDQRAVDRDLAATATENPTAGARSIGRQVVGNHDRRQGIFDRDRAVKIIENSAAAIVVGRDTIGIERFVVADRCAIANDDGATVVEDSPATLGVGRGAGRVGCVVIDRGSQDRHRPGAAIP